MGEPLEALEAALEKAGTIVEPGQMIKWPLP